jgi:subtilisin family serine protease
MSKKLFSVLSVLVLLSMLVVPVSATPAPASATTTAGGAPVIEPDGAQGPAVYIIQLADSPVATYTGGVDGLEATSPAATGAAKLDAKSPASLAYAAYLEGKQADAIAAFNRVLGRQIEVKFQYQHAYNGIATELTPAEARLVAQVEGVTQVYRETIEELLTDAGPAWIGAPAVWGSPSGNKGEGVIAGIIDTGINHDHPSFADVGGDGYNHTNPYGAGAYVGWCVANPSFCNDKLIGAWNFVTPGTTPEDDDGHGSHTSSTVAGNVMQDADFIAPTTSYTFPFVSGVAPHANVIMYKACGTGGCPGSATTASVNQAVIDGADVLNYSISGGTQPYTDPTSVAFLNANTAGVFAAASAGNSGPTAGTTNHKEPWNLTVAASTHDRAFLNSVVNMSGGGSTPPADILGEGATLGYGPASIVYAGDYAGNNLCGPFPAGTFTGQIVVCDRGTYGRVEKGQNVLNAGGGGMVLVNDQLSAASLNADGHVLPAVHISYADGTVLKTWLSSGSGHTATITGGTVSQYAEHGDNMASFSSRGPSGFNLIKPDVTAPGLNILAAVATLPGGPPAPEYNIMSGTSMSSPHAAGAAALMRALHPGWSPTQIKSAIMLTGVTSVNKEDNTTPADPDDMGAGRINLDGAMDAGFVLDVTRAEYDAANPTLGGDMGELNLPSMSNTECPGFCSWTRNLQSVLGNSVDYSVSTSGEPGLVLSVDQPSFTLAAGGNQQVVITADVVAGTPGETLFGEVVFTPSDPTVAEMHMPVAVVVGAAPAQIEVTPATVNSTQLPIFSTQPMTITNLGDEALTWEIFDDATPINQPAVDWSENFDSYVTGSQMHGQGGWKGWFNDPAAGALTSDVQAHSTPNSVAIVGASDLVHEYAGYTSGRWTYTAYQYIPSGTTGQTYFILLNSYDDLGTDLNWSVQVLFDPAAGIVANEGTTVGTLPLLTDQWVELRVEIDLINDRQDFYYGGQLLYTSTWTGEVSGNGALNVGAVDLFANGASVVYYDDISLVENPLQICDIPGDVPWLSASPASGSTLGGASSAVNVGFNATGMTPGEYTATLCVASNDFLNPVVPVPVTMTVEAFTYGVELTPAEAAQSGDAGETVTYTLSLTNTGNYTDTFLLDASGNAWDVQLPFTSTMVASGESVPVAVAVTVPASALNGDTDTVTVTANSDSEPLAMAESVLTTTAQLPPARLEVGHLAPFAMDPGTAVTVTLDGTDVLTGFEFATSTGYLDITPGITHTVEIFAAGVPTPAISAEINLMSGVDYSAIAVGGANGWPLDLLALVDDNSAPAAGNFKLRLGHLAPFADTITGTLADVRLQDGTIILDDVPFGAVASYVELPAGSYDLKITSPDGSVTYIDPLPVTFNDGDIVSAFAVGDGANQPLGVFAWPSGVAGFLLPLAQPSEGGMIYLPLVPQGYSVP